jgi:hypothetical protein
MVMPDETGIPGKTRTWWHPLLVRLLEYALSPAYEVRDEVSVGTLPLRADIVLVRREQAEVPELARRSLPALVERLNRWTLIEFKSPVDSLERGDLDRLLGVAHLFCAQQPEPIASANLSLVILAPSLTKPFEADAKLRGLVLLEEEPGVFRIEGGVFVVWLLEADRLTGPGEPAVTVFSRVFLRDPRVIMQMVRDPATDPALRYVYQQIRQFHQLGDAFMVQHTHTAEMDQEYAAFRDAFIQSLGPDERLAGLSAEDVFEALTPEQRVRLLDLLKAKASSEPEE